MSGIFDADKIAAQLMRNAGGYADFMADPSGTYEWDGGHVASYEAAKLVEDLAAEVARLRAVIAEAEVDAMDGADRANDDGQNYGNGIADQAQDTLSILAKADQTDKEAGV